MAIADDFEIDASGNITHASGTTVYTVLEMHAWLQDLADNAEPGANDLVSILSLNPSELAGKRNEDIPASMTLLNSFNIDDTAAQYINFGSVAQGSGATLYSGLKTIGGIVASSPMYVVQNGSKLTKFWSDGHIQVMVKVKASSALIDSGNVTVYSRKWGQKYSHFDVNLAAGGETSAAVQTAVDANITLTEEQASALSSDVTVTFGTVSHDLGNGNGSKNYDVEVALTNGATLAEMYQYLQWLTREGSTSTVNGVSGWRYRSCNSSYTENTEAPFGSIAGGKFIGARGVLVTGVLSSEATSYQLVAADGTSQVPPNVIGFSVSNLTTSDYLIAGRDDGSGGFLDDEYSLASGNGTGDGTIVVKEAIKSDTPSTGTVRMANGDKYAYTSWATSTFTLSGTLSDDYAEDADAWVPFIDKQPASTTESITFIYDDDFTMRVKSRLGSGATPIVPFESTVGITSGGGSMTVIRNSDV